MLPGALLAAAAAVAPACETFDMPAGSRPVQIPSANVPPLDLEKIDLSALAVDRIRVHPLTRWEDVEADPRLIVHVELRDRYGHAVKGFGELRIELEGRGDGDEPAVWSIDLVDPDNNARYYDDLISRTYQISITGLPAWVKDWLASAEPDDWMRVNAYFRTVDADGRERILHDDLRIPP
jgi:hypothetical protein